ncbi:hypothetical protein B0H13DRAFT_2350041 [Mycena leptocephala]|nr:hypothetical protein B0H13DRAFT_2350041 [Mycena leptocephala]
MNFSHATFESQHVLRSRGYALPTPLSSDVTQSARVFRVILDTLLDQARLSSRCLPSYHCRWCRCDEIGTETSCYSSDPPPPDAKPQRESISLPSRLHHAQTNFRHYGTHFLTIITTLLIIWAANEARQRNRGLCCFTGRPSGCITWIIPPLLPVLLPFPSTFSREQCISVDNVFAISSDLLEAYHDNRITIDPQDGYRIVVFAEFPHLSTLAVRLTGCDAAFDGVSALEAGELLDELTWDSDQNHMIPQGSKWSTSAGQEAIRTFFWARWRLARARTKCIQVQLPHTCLDTTVGVGSDLVIIPRRIMFQLFYATYA